MIPAICVVCKKMAGENLKDSGDWVKFANYEKTDCYEGIIGERWFCAAHLPAARNVQHLNDYDALVELNKLYRMFSASENPTHPFNMDELMEEIKNHSLMQKIKNYFHKKDNID